MLDETTIADHLHEATGDLTAPGDLAQRVRHGGARRRRQRQLAATLGTVVAVGIVVPTAIALVPQSSHPTKTQPGHDTNSGLYASPPTGQQPCTHNGGHGTSPASYPSLLMLPPGTPMTYAFTNSGGAPRCNFFPHVAATITQRDGDQLKHGAVVYGPNAVKANQDGYTDNAADFSGDLLHPTVDGVTGTAFYIPQNRTAQVYWTDRSGGQWQVTMAGFSTSGLARFLSEVSFDPVEGNAVLTQQLRGDGYTSGPSAPDWRGRLPGVFYAEWQEPHGRAALTVDPGPNRVRQIAAQGKGRALVPINGRPGVLYRDGTSLVWQVAPKITANLMVERGDASSIIQIAQSIAPISPNDPRLHRPS